MDRTPAEQGLSVVPFIWSHLLPAVPSGEDIVPFDGPVDGFAATSPDHREIRLHRITDTVATSVLHQGASLELGGGTLPDGKLLLVINDYAGPQPKLVLIEDVLGTPVKTELASPERTLPRFSIVAQRQSGAIDVLLYDVTGRLWFARKYNGAWSAPKATTASVYGAAVENSLIYTPEGAKLAFVKHVDVPRGVAEPFDQDIVYVMEEFTGRWTEGSVQGLKAEYVGGLGWFARPAVANDRGVPEDSAVSELYLRASPRFARWFHTYSGLGLVYQSTDGPTSNQLVVRQPEFRPGALSSDGLRLSKPVATGKAYALPGAMTDDVKSAIAAHKREKAQQKPTTPTPNQPTHPRGITLFNISHQAIGLCGLSPYGQMMAFSIAQSGGKVTLGPTELEAIYRGTQSQFLTLYVVPDYLTPNNLTTSSLSGYDCQSVGGAPWGRFVDMATVAIELECRDEIMGGFVACDED
ncbi:hypothetical protein [Sorangium sp. So ce145]|uniref:hypothetical protein n=1 Tax=Sorangium sp. So ce145 TaxID=3133285 RepID=UPI003F603196